MTRSVSLYERTEALTIVREFLEESQGELTPEIEALLDQAEGDFETKVERVALFIREQEGEAARVGAERERLAAREKALGTSVEKLKRYLKQNLEVAGKTKVAGDLVTVAIQKNSTASVEVDPTLKAEDLPPQFTKTIPARVEVDREAVLNAWKAQEAQADLPDNERVRIVPLGITVTRGTHVRIR